jgi:hypothetical protein
MKIDAAVGLARDGRPNHVADGQDLVPAPFGFAQAGQRVGGFARLRDDQNQRVLLNGRVAIAKFAGVFDFRWDVGEFFEQIFADQRRMPAGAAGRDDNVIDLAQLRQSHVQAAEFGGGVVVSDAAAQGVADGLGLLMDFLEHEMRELAALGSFRIELELADLYLGGVGAQVGHAKAVRVQGHHVVIVEIDHLPRVGRDGGGVAGQKIFTFTHADDQWGAAPGPDHDLGIVGAYNRDAVSADHFAQGVHHRLGQRMEILFESGLRGAGGRAGPAFAQALANLLVVGADEPGQDFGIGGRQERRVVEAFLEPFKVLDDAVVHDGDASAGVVMGVRILVGRGAMGRPTGVADAQLAADRLGLEQVRQAFVDLALFLPGLQPAVAQDSHASAVVSSVFKAPQPLQNDWSSLPFSNVANDAAHLRNPVLVAFRFVRLRVGFESNQIRAYPSPAAPSFLTLFRRIPAHRHTHSSVAACSSQVDQCIEGSVSSARKDYL